MSDYENHSGKARLCLRNDGETFDEHCERLLEKEGRVFSDYSSDIFDADKYIRVGDEIWEVYEHKEWEDGDIVRLKQNEDGTVDFLLRFYNGGTCLQEILQEELADIEKKIQDDPHEFL